MDIATVNQMISLSMSVVVPTGAVCYLVIKLTIKSALADFLTVLRQEFVMQNLCTKTHELDNEKIENLSNKIDSFEEQLKIYLQQRKTG